MCSCPRLTGDFYSDSPTIFSHNVQPGCYAHLLCAPGLLAQGIVLRQAHTCHSLCSAQGFSNFSVHAHHLGILLKHRLGGPDWWDAWGFCITENPQGLCTLQTQSGATGLWQPKNPFSPLTQIHPVLCGLSQTSAPQRKFLHFCLDTSVCLL